MARRTLAAVFIAVLTVAAGCHHIPDAGRLGMRDYGVDPSIKHIPSNLSDLVKNPSVDMHVVFEAIFDRHDEKIWSPLYTPFTPEDYASFSAWPPEARLWELEGRQSSVATFFMAKQHPNFAAMKKLSRYQHVQFKGTVRSIFGDPSRPWIEIASVTVLGQSAVYDDESLRRLIFGMEDSAKAPAAAIMNLDMALRGRLHTPARVVAHAALGDLYEKRAAVTREFWKNAFDHYDAAVHLDPSQKACRAGLDRAAIQIDLLRKEQEMKEQEPPPQDPPPQDPPPQDPPKPGQ
jgi:hypothetical protein